VRIGLETNFDTEFILDVKSRDEEALLPQKEKKRLEILSHLLLVKVHTDYSKMSE